MKQYMALAICAVVAVGLCLGSPAALADRGHWDVQHDHDRSHNEPHDRGHDFFLDNRYHHDRLYPRHGFHVDVLPRGYLVVPHGGFRYYFSAGVWYQPLGPRFVVVTPPLGITVPVLPLFFTTVWVRGIPYYYADGVYYVWSPSALAYVVTQSPRVEDVSTSAPTGADTLFIYPKNGQSEDQQATDRYECDRWSVDQTGYDPTQSTGAGASSQQGEKRDDYRRAMAACLDARGYSVK
jgi:hypothetical protein